MSLRRRGWWWVVLAVPLALGLARLRFDVDVLALLPDDLPAVQGLKLHQKHFANARELITRLRAADPADAETAAQRLADQLRQETNLTSSVLWQPPWLEHPEATAELIAYLWLNQPSPAFQKLADGSPKQSHEVLTQTRNELAGSLSPLELGRLSYDPLGLTRLPESAGAPSLFGEGQSGRLGRRDIPAPVRSAAARVARLSGLCGLARTNRQAVEQCRQAPDWPKRPAWPTPGSPAFTAEIATHMENDLRQSALGTLVLVAVLFGGAPAMAAAALVAVVIGLHCCLHSGVGWADLRAIECGQPRVRAILLGLAVDYALLLYQEALAAPAKSAEDVRRELRPASSGRRRRRRRRFCF